jgi:hypothetical protein
MATQQLISQLPQPLIDRISSIWWTVKIPPPSCSCIHKGDGLEPRSNRRSRPAAKKHQRGGDARIGGQSHKQYNACQGARFFLAL